MKLSVSTYSFNGLVRTGEFNEFELIGLAADMDFDGIEFADIHPPEGAGKKEYAEKLSAECKKQGIAPVNYTIGADFIYGSDGDIDKEIERLKKEIEIAEILGVSGVRHDATGGYKKEDRKQRGFDDALPRIIEGCKEITEYAKAKGIKTMIENHGQFCQESRRVEKIINGVSDENFGVLIDFGNFLCADEEPELAVGRLAPYAFHIHAKDFQRKSGNGIIPPNAFFKTRAGNHLRAAIIGHGDAPVFQCLSIIKDAGYGGFVSIEFEGIEENKMAVQYGKNTLDLYMGMLSVI
ncbi:MAG: sugar phosphate isomerase/epimerase [Oscillospiraceae bacterium]|nr:sugar phosphate isomerase/epimerase [Oscillospiraceae bacterium]